MLMGPCPQFPQNHWVTGGRIVCGLLDGSVGDGISYVCWCNKIVKRRMRMGWKWFVYSYLSIYFSIRFHLRDEDNRYGYVCMLLQDEVRGEGGGGKGVSDFSPKKKVWREMWCLGFGNWWCEIVELKVVWAKEQRKVGALALFILISFGVLLKDEASKKWLSPATKKKYLILFFLGGRVRRWSKSLGGYFSSCYRNCENR